MLHEDHQPGPQLPGLTPEHVALVAATGLLLLFAFSYLTSDSSLLIRQSKRSLFEMFRMRIWLNTV